LRPGRTARDDQQETTALRCRVQNAEAAEAPRDEVSGDFEAE